VPEGDTIWRTARTLEVALAGKVVLAFDSSLPAVRRVPQGEPARSTYLCPGCQKPTASLLSRRASARR
jgi:formamidopyrimidine-DNA glycosylase